MQTDYVIKKKRKTIENNILPNKEIIDQEKENSINENNIILEKLDRKPKDNKFVKQFVFLCFFTIFCSFIILFFIQSLKNDAKIIEDKRDKVLSSQMSFNDSIKEEYKNDIINNNDLHKIREKIKRSTETM